MRKPKVIRVDVFYVYDDGSAEPKSTVVKFCPIDGVPGFSHRVVIAEKACDWLPDKSRPSVKNAIYFWQKHKDKI